MPRAIGAKAKLRMRCEFTYGTAASENSTQLPSTLEDSIVDLGDRRTAGGPAHQTATVIGAATAASC